MSIQDLPAVNASLNGLAALFILAGLFAIRADRKQVHRFCMVAAIAVSAVFLTCYLIYHFKSPMTRFTHEGWPKTVYFFILITHVPLAFLVLPLLWVTVLPALRGDYEKHRKWVKVTAPVWLYVSVTGVLVYFMLYVWYPPLVQSAG